MKIQERTLEGILKGMEKTDEQFEQLALSEEPSEEGKKAMAKIKELLGIDTSLGFDKTLKAIDEHPDNKRVKQVLIEVINSL